MSATKENANGTAIHNARTWLDDIVDRVEAEIPKLKARRDAMLSEVADINEQIKKAEAMLRVVEPKIQKPKKETRRNRTSQVGTEKMWLIVDWINKNYGDTEKFSVIQVHQNVFGETVTIATTRSAFKFLRSIEFIGRAGQTTTNPKRQLWRVIDRDAYHRHQEGANASQK